MKLATPKCDSIVRFTLSRADKSENRKKYESRNNANSFNSIKQYIYRELDFIQIFNLAYEDAKISLKKTPEKLSILKKSGVVYAGAQGFIDFLKGIKIFIQNGKVEPVKNSIVPEPIENYETDLSNEYRYCTECLLSGEDIDRPKLKKQLMNLGDSIVLAGSKKKAKIHIHTNEPQAIFTLCSEYGQISGEKADDMLKQQNTVHGTHEEIAIIVDSACDLPENIIEDLNIHMVPLRFNFGDDHHVDKVTITSDEFWNELENNPNHPQRKIQKNLKPLCFFIESCATEHLAQTRRARPSPNTVNISKCWRATEPRDVAKHSWISFPSRQNPYTQAVWGIMFPQRAP